MTRIRPQSLFVALWLFQSLALAACDEGRQGDRDGDGLGDQQEALFGTDPDNPDTDADGLLDGEDPDPLHAPLDQSLSISVKTSRAQNLDEQWSTTLTLTFWGGDGDKASPPVLLLSTTLGELTGVQEQPDGSFKSTLTSANPGIAQVTIQAGMSQDTVQTRTVRVYLMESVLPRPGINPAPYAGTGGVDGQLTVYVLKGESLTDPESVPEGARDTWVQVALSYAPEKTWTAWSDETGIVEFNDPELVGPVNITAAREGCKVVTVLAVNAGHVSLSMRPFDPIPGAEQATTGTIRGRVVGFDGEFGVTPFEPSVGWQKFSIGIVQRGLTNVELVSMSMGSVLSYSHNADTGASLWDLIPPNMVLYQDDSPEAAEYQLNDIEPGTHLVYVFAGSATQVMETLKDPYALQFHPTAMGFTVVDVGPGETVEADIRLEVDLSQQRVSGTGVYDVNLGSHPEDPMTLEPFPNGLLMSVIDMGRYGYIFADVNGVCNLPGFENPIEIVYPDPEHPVLKDLGVTPYRMTVGLAGRKSFLGADPPGISTVIRRDQEGTSVIDMDKDYYWLRPPVGLSPTPPDESPVVSCLEYPELKSTPGMCVTLDASESLPTHYIPLDRVGGTLQNRTLSWAPVSRPRNADLYAVRLGYLVSAPRNPTATGFSIGGPSSHKLWEVIAPSHVTQVTLPALPGTLFGGELLHNPAANLQDALSPHRYGPKTLEVEFTAYLMGEVEPFVYNDDFSFDEMNLNSLSVSQDSYPFAVP